MDKNRNTNKKSKRKIIILCALLLIMLVIIGIGGFTYAKYIAQETGSGSATIADWSFKIEKDAGQQVKTVNLADSAERDSVVNGKIAPGTSGSFRVTLDSTGADVTTRYNLRFFGENNKPENLFFTYDGKKYNSLAEIGVIGGFIGHQETDRKVSLIIKWEWPYETGTTEEEKSKNNQIDTQDANLDDYTFSMIATGDQIW